MRMEHQCPQCASVHLTLIREMTYAAEWRCTRCANLFVNPLVSVVLVDRLDARREALAAACFQFLPTRARLDLQGWENDDIFAHS